MEHYQPHNSIDPSSLPPPPPFFSSATSATIELPPVVNFPPAQPPIPNQTSYDGMIVAAISALREKDGSSRQAIARYIERVYTNLPPNHSLLLTNNLKRLKNSGQITMLKHSYLLPSGSNPSPSPPLFTTTAAAAASSGYSFSPAPPLFTTNPPPPPPQFMADTAPPPPPFSTTTTDGVATSLASPPPSQPKKRGRPPKPKSDLTPAHPAQVYAPVGPVPAQYQSTNGPEQTQIYVAGPIGSVQDLPDGLGEAPSKRKRGRPKKEKPIEAQFTCEAQNSLIPPAAETVAAGSFAGESFVVQSNGGVSGSEAMLVSLGLSDGPSPAKMRPRRTHKPTIAASQPEVGAQNGRKKKLGRPRKFNPSVAVQAAPGVYPVQVPVGTSPPLSNRGRGRPKKYAVVPMPNGAANGILPKKRGRRPKIAAGAPSFSVPVSFMLPDQLNAGGGVMMPQAIFVQPGGDASAAVAPVHLPVTGGYNGVVYPGLVKRGRGRPPGRPAKTDGTGLKKPRRLSGKPLGRPRKDHHANSEDQSDHHTNSEDQSFEIVYLKKKIDYLQSKIREAVPVIKSYLNAEEPNAMGALKDLERLGTLDFGGAPVNVQTQQQPPAQQLQAEQQ